MGLRILGKSSTRFKKAAVIMVNAVMAKLLGRVREESKLTFAVEEIVLSFVGATILCFGVLVLLISHVQGLKVDWPSFILSIFVVWLGLLLFMVPIIRKIEQLM